MSDWAIAGVLCIFIKIVGVKSAIVCEGFAIEVMTSLRSTSDLFGI
ncbi:hypothetical protein [Microcoleus sp. CAWBG24]|nr:hypothetical protein [Microcoleus sp. CAWBG24]